MPLTEQDELVLSQIRQWEEKQSDYMSNDFEMLYGKWLEQSMENIDPELRNKFFDRLDTILFHLHALLQGTRNQMDAKDRILTMAKVFDDSIEDISDMRTLSIDRLKYIADQQISKHRMLSFAQGGLTGTGGVLLLGIDIPAVVAMNLRAIQLVATTYGYDVNVPKEMMTSLKVFHAATMPRRMQYEGWVRLKGEIEDDSGSYWYEGTDQLTDETWMEQPLKQILKVVFVSMFRKKLIQGLPLIGMGIGAVLNYQLTRHVTDYAHRFYQLRYLHDKQNETSGW